MNTRQQLYKKNRLLGMTKHNAARSAGYSEATAKSHTKQLEDRLKIADVLERHGLTDNILVLRLSELLKASKVVGYLHNYKKVDKGGVEKISPDEIVSNEFIDVPDWSARAKGLELALKLKDLLKDKLEHSGEIKTGETRIVIIQNAPPKEDARPLGEAESVKQETRILSA
jgi:phage terminase small subunit